MEVPDISKIFLSTPSARRATRSSSVWRAIKAQFLSTPSARRATRKLYHEALVMGHFYPRPPRGGRQFCSRDKCGFDTFLSTPSARRATCKPFSHSPSVSISIHALREEGDRRGDVFPPGPHRISIHALREEGDSINSPKKNRRKPFLSTPSARRATVASRFLTPPAFQFLSTPSARRATRAVIETAQALKNFYPRPPRGGRRTV